MTFHLSIAREVLSAALGRAALCATTRMSIPVLGSVKLEPCEGGLRLTTTNPRRSGAARVMNAIDP